MNENLSEQFIGNGFFISDTTTFNKELKATNMEPYDLLNKLLNLQKQANTSSSIVDFSKGMIAKMNNLEKILEDDEYYRKSDKESLEKVSKDIAAINQKFEAIKNYLAAEENMLTHKQYLLDAKKKLYLLGKNTELSDEERTSQTLKIREEIKACQASYDEYFKICNEQKAIYNKSVQGTNVVDFKNDLLKAINTLEDDCKTLAISQSTKEKIKESIVDMRNVTAYYALDSIKSKNEFDALCKRYGLTHDGKIRNTTPSEEKKNNEEKIEKVESDLNKEEINPEYDGPVKEGEQLAVVEPQKEKPNPEYDGPVKEGQEIAIPKDTPEEIIDVYTTPTKTPEKKIEEPKVKVVARRACKWINKHKKQILIAIGISLLIVAVIVALQYLIPAITAMLKTSEVATLSSTMINNGALWHGAVAGEQMALHSANTALASTIQTMTGSQALFNTGTGIWTFGGTELSKFAASAIANAASAASTATAISNGVLGLGITGLGLTGLGAILPKKRSEAYQKILNSIKDLKKNIANMSHEEVQQKVAQILAEIETTEGLTANEKNRLINKSDKIIDKSSTLEEAAEETKDTYSIYSAEIADLENNLSSLSKEEIKGKIYQLVPSIKENKDLTNEEKIALISQIETIYNKSKNISEVENLEPIQTEKEEGRGR